MGLVARLVAAGVVLLSAVQGATAADGYRLLRLAGTWVKWGDPAIGSSARVTYALATGRMDFPDARNCRSIVPVAKLLRQSHIAKGLFQRELRAAFDAWSRAADIIFIPVDDPAKADIVVSAQYRPRGKAYTNVSFDPGDTGEIRRIRKSLICLNPAVPWKVGFDGNVDIYDLRYTLLHEIGHAIGLDHPSPSGQVMSFKYNENFRDLTAGDMFGASLLYGGRDAIAGAAVRPVAAAPDNRGGEIPGAPAARPQLSLGAGDAAEIRR